MKLLNATLAAVIVATLLPAAISTPAAALTIGTTRQCKPPGKLRCWFVTPLKTRCACEYSAGRI